MNFLGKTLSFPIRADVRGTVANALSDDDIIVQSILDLLETRQGERKMLPNYGLPDVLFDALDATFAPRLAFFIEEQIFNYIPAIQSVSAIAGTINNDRFESGLASSPHKAAIRILWTKRGELVPQELIYPTWKFNAGYSIAVELPVTNNDVSTTNGRYIMFGDKFIKFEGERIIYG